MKKKKLYIGVDFGTDSVCALLVNVANWEELASSEFEYPRWKAGCYCNAIENQFRQSPLDYLEGLEYTILKLIDMMPEASADVFAIGIDTTASTLIAVNEYGIPLALLPDFKGNPNAQFVLWKDRTATEEAEEINALCHNWGGINFAKHSGVVYSSEWFWAKILHIIREDKKVKNAAYSWVEHCDWIPAILSGQTNPKTIKRSRYIARRKAMWHKEWGGLPSAEFLNKLDPYLKDLRLRLYDAAYTCDISVGTLSQEWAERLKLNESVVVSKGALDVHIGARGGILNEKDI